MRVGGDIFLGSLDATGRSSAVTGFIMERPAGKMRLLVTVITMIIAALACLAAEEAVCHQCCSQFSLAALPLHGINKERIA